jgi:hypothetical protein
MPIISDTRGMWSTEADNDGEDSSFGIADEPHSTFLKATD